MTANAYDWLHERVERRPSAPEQKPDGVFLGKHLVEYLGEDVEMAVYARASVVDEAAAAMIDRISVTPPAQDRSRDDRGERALTSRQSERPPVNLVDASKTHLRAAKRLSGWAALLICLDAATMGISHQHLAGLAWESGTHPVQTAENVVAIPVAVVHVGKSILDGVNKLGSLGGKLG